MRTWDSDLALNRPCFMGGVGNPNIGLVGHCNNRNIKMIFLKKEE